MEFLACAGSFIKQEQKQKAVYTLDAAGNKPLEAGGQAV
jgi:hypothetical protein